MKRSYREWLLKGSAAAVLALPVVSSIAFAQKAEIDKNRAEIETIVVTATKRTEKLAQDVAVSLSAIGEDALSRRGAYDFSSYAEGLASLSFADRGPGQQLIAMRGVNASSTVVNTDEPEAQAAVGVYFDETSVSLAGFNPDLKLFDVNRIEVLRGPQGTLFGAGSMSGVIRIITNEPNMSETSGKTDLLYSRTKGGDNNFSVNGMINIPFVEDKLALRVTGWQKHDGGFIDNVAPLVDPRHRLFGTSTDLSSIIKNVNTEDTFGGRAQLKAALTENFAATLKVFHQETHLGGTQNEDTFQAGAVRPGNNPADATLLPYQQSRTTAEPFDDKFTLYSLEANWDLDLGTVTSVTSYLDRFQTNIIEASDLLQSFFGPGFAGVTDVLINSTDVQDFSQEIRFAGESNDGRWDWLIGGFYNRQHKVFIQDAPTTGLTAASMAFGSTDFCNFLTGGAFANCAAFGAATGTNQNPENIFESTSTFTTKQVAFFGEVGFDISDQLKVIGGVRYFHYDQHFIFSDVGGAFTGGSVIDTSISENGWNPKFTIEYRPVEDILIYADAAKGFRLGGINDPASPFACGASSPSFKSDSLWTYEVGGKTTFDKRIQLNGAAYYTNWSDVPIGDPLNGCGIIQTRNAGSVTIKGAEGDLTIAVTDQLSWSLSASYTDAKFDNNVVGLSTPLIVTAGDRLPVVPKYIIGSHATYYFPVSVKSGLEGFVNVDFSYRSSQFNDVKSAGGVEMAGYYNVNAKVGITGGDGWKLSLFVNNLTDQHNIIFKDTIFLGQNRDSVNQPRTIGTDFTMGF